MSVINQSIKQDTIDFQKPKTSTVCGTVQNKQKQCSAEGWWIKPRNIPYVEAVKIPKATAKTTSLEPIPNPPIFYFSSDDE